VELKRANRGGITAPPTVRVKKTTVGRRRNATTTPFSSPSQSEETEILNNVITDQQYNTIQYNTTQLYISTDILIVLGINISNPDPGLRRAVAPGRLYISYDYMGADKHKYHPFGTPSSICRVAVKLCRISYLTIQPPSTAMRSPIAS